MDDLRWLGLEWDEGPDLGGEYGPYRQGEAAPLHRESAMELVQSGHAFRCYCTEEELAQEAEATESGLTVHRYSGRCRALGKEERDRLDAEGVPWSVRFRVDPGEIAVRDAIRGDVSFDGADFGDFVILRPDGRATYNFAVVVDDIRMRISHVIRGVGHLSNTPKQGLLFDALGVDRPTFAHLPTVLGPDRKKLSKREGAAAIEELRKEGYHPDAILNYTSLLGWSSVSEEEVLAREELIREMDLERVGASDTIFDPAKMRWLSGQHIARMELEELVRQVAPRIDRDRYPVPDERLTYAVEAVRTRISTFGEINVHFALLYPEPNPEFDRTRRDLASDPDGRRVLESARRALDGLAQWDSSAIMQTIRAVGKEIDARGPRLFHPIRIAVSGETSGPDLGKVLQAIGREETIERITDSLALRSD